MSKLILGISIFIMAVLVYLAFGFMRQAAEFSLKTRLAHKENSALMRQIEEVSVFADGHLPSIEESYRRLYESTRAAAHMLDSKFIVEAVDLSGTGPITEALRPSRFYGVDALSVKLAFSQMRESDQYGQILRIFSNLENRLPMEIMGIKGFDKNLEIDIELYGLPRRV